MTVFPFLFCHLFRHATAAIGSLRQGDDKLPQADPLTPPLGRRAGVAKAARKEKTAMFLTALVLMFPLPGPLFADQRSNLTPGIYQAGPGGCAHPSGVGTMTFDGDNFSGNHQFCKTTPLDKPYQYQLDCMDLMGGKSPANFDTDPDRERFVLTIRVQDPHSFTIDGQRYDYCGGLK